MSDPIYIFSPGLWRLRREVESLSQRKARVPLLPRGRGAVAGWGHAAAGRRVARGLALPFFSFDGGFLRSLKPGQKPSAMIIDGSGIYHDARRPSDLEAMLENATFPSDECAAAAEFVAVIASRRLSQYNDSRDGLNGADIPRGKALVLVIDQARDDSSVAGALADGQNFARMTEAALAENPDAAVLVKLHTGIDAEPGYLGDLARARGCAVLAGNVNPHDLLQLAPKVYTVSSHFGFEAVLAGCEVVCFGAPFYSGWGLTDDRVRIARRTRRRTIPELAAAAYLRYSHYFDVWTRQPVSALTATDQLHFQRQHYLGNARPVVCFKIARWKRRAVAAMLDGPNGTPLFIRNLPEAAAEARRRQGAIAAWGMTAVKLRQSPETSGLACVSIEDGFLRSAGLGAAFVAPLSLVFDGSGIYYDPSQASDLEQLLAAAEFTSAELSRAERLRATIVAQGVTKYNLADSAGVPSMPQDRARILVVGQVADDAAVRAAVAAEISDQVNARLLRAVRLAHPDAHVIFKPHPDVEHIGRPGALTEEQERHDANWVARSVGIEQLLAQVDHVETFGSLAGFEALLRGLPVRVHGLPFYAGWGLTEDLQSSPRRKRSRSVTELVVAAVIRYPRYWDPVSGLACPPETVLERLQQFRAEGPPRVARAGLIAGRAVVVLRKLARNIGMGKNG